MGVTLLLCIPAGLFWLWYVWRKARLHPPPIWLVGVAAVLGALSPKGVHWFDDFLSLHEIPYISTLTDPTSLAYFIILVGMVEETCKMLAVRCTVYYSRTFDDPMHGVVYSSAAALGFATVENTLYVSAYGYQVMMGRAILSTFGHVLLSMVWGFALGAQRTRVKRGFLPWLGGWATLLLGVVLAAILHGLYDWFLQHGHMWLALLLLFTLWRIFVAQTEFVRHHSPHRRPSSRRMRECTACHGLVREEGLYCGTCGLAVSPDAGQFCESCGKSLSGEETACATCGLLLR